MAVIKRFDCVWGKMCRRSYCSQSVFCFFLVFLIIAQNTLANPTTSKPTESCDNIKNSLERRGMLSGQVLSRPENGKICGAGSCCTTVLEENLLNNTRIHIERYVKDTILKISNVIDSRAKRFDDTFQEMLNNSKFEFHEMFERTYGKIYLQNAKVFTDFFYELETYYKKGKIRLSETMAEFFQKLYNRMFTVLNAQYSFDDKYLECVTANMNDLMPFGDVPSKLTHQLCRTFVATRTFYKSLSRVSESLKQLANLHIDEDCINNLTVMQFCGHCKGLNGAGSCSNYCVDMAMNCLWPYMKLNEGWDAFVNGIDKIAERLIGPYNIESVVEPLNIKVSEAIMNFQENGKEVSQRIFSKCGKPPLNRPKRRAGYDNLPEGNPNIELPQEQYKPGGGGGGGGGKRKHKKAQQKVEEDRDDLAILDKLVAEIKTKVKDTKQIWYQLPYQYCNNPLISAGPSENGGCWNGTSIGNYSHITSTKIKELVPTTIGQYISTLDLITESLKKAYQGVEVEIVDDTEEIFAGSGSGSGNGEEIDDDEDRPRSNNNNMNRNDNNSNDNDDNDDEDENNSNDDLKFDVTIVKTNEANPPILPPNLPSTRRPEVVRTSSANRNSMSLNRALVEYLVPLVMVWFGGAIRDLL